MKLISRLINQCLMQTPHHGNLLENLSGQSAEIIFTDLSLGFTLDFQSEGIQIDRLDKKASEANDATRISGPSQAFLGFVMTHDLNQAMRAGLKMQGNSTTLENIKRLFFSTNIDWEEFMAHYLGDPLAHLFGTMARRITRGYHEKAQSLKRSLVEYLEEESKSLPHPWKVNEFCQAMDELNHAVSRVEARINFLDSDLTSEPISQPQENCSRENV